MHQTLYAQIQEEFDRIADTFSQKEKEILEDENLIILQSKYNLHDIQPYHAQLTNETLPPDAKLIIESEEDFDPELDDLYDYRIDFESRKAYLKRLHFGEDVFYSTIYEYDEDEEYHKSFSIYQNNGNIKATNLSYLYFRDGLPYQFIECTEYGISLKTYTCDDTFIKSYKLEWPDYDHHCIGELSYNPDGDLIKIVETVSDGRVRLLFEAGLETRDIETVLEELENFLVENIADQILEKVSIEEPVYCILFEYTMQGPFPPTIAFGVASEIEGTFEDHAPCELYNAPDMRYFSEHDKPRLVNIDFYPEDIQSAYLITTAHSTNIPWQDEEASETWEQQVKDVYLRVCKRLMHFDFSSSFTKTAHFLVMARDFEQCNEEELFEEMMKYKREKGL